MAKTATKTELLKACVQDLHAARLIAIARLPVVIATAGAELSSILEDLRRDFRRQAHQFEAMDHELDGPDNLWMAGVMDDAERDTTSIVGGSLLDVALVGAVRKGVAADAVSIETAVEVAGALGREDDAQRMQSMREVAGSFDKRLRELLQRLA